MLGEYRISGRRASEIAASIERGVGSGDLPPGHVLPPMRELATRLEVNPNTVAAAYRTLRERGVIETAGRRGSRIRSAPASTSRGSLRVEAPPGVRDLGEGNPDPALLPDLGPALAAAAAADAESRGLYGQAPVVAEFAARARSAMDADG
ncbi:GntR family transcriptional regulator, partial [Streptomyces sp. SID8016]|nr:GntR family transcriptional regulator [Streptomyces sp. SID8016]